MDALIIDAWQEPRSIGKAGKGASQDSLRSNLAQRITRAGRSHLASIARTSRHYLGTSPSAARRAAISAGWSALDAVTTCGQRRHARPILWLRHHQRQHCGQFHYVGLEDLVISCGTEMMCDGRPRAMGRFMMDNRQSSFCAAQHRSRIRASAPMRCNRSKAHAQDVDEPGSEQKRAAAAIRVAISTRSLCRSTARTVPGARSRGISAAGRTTLEGPPG